MIVNHKDAISFLVSAADEIGFNRSRFSICTAFWRRTCWRMRQRLAG